MARSLPSTVVAGMFAPQSGVTILALLTITHADISTIRVVNNTEDVVSGGLTYTAFPFSVVLPPETDEGPQSLKVTVSNVSREIVQAARSIAGSANPAQATIHFVAYDDPDTSLLAVTGRKVQNLQYDASFVSFDAALEFFTNEPFPAMTFTPGRFKGLF